jgi:hypothetical protein
VLSWTPLFFEFSWASLLSTSTVSVKVPVVQVITSQQAPPPSNSMTRSLVLEVPSRKKNAYAPPLAQDVPPAGRMGCQTLVVALMDAGAEMSGRRKTDIGS